MSITVIFLFLFLILSFTSIFLYLKLQDERNKNLYADGLVNPYKKKKYFLTLDEKELFLILQNLTVNSNYLVFPQLHLSTLLQVKEESNDLAGKFEWLNKLFVDFVLFDKKDLQPRLVIELNDSTHLWGNRKARDQFVKKSLEENNIPFLVIETESLINGQAKEIVEEKIRNI